MRRIDLTDKQLQQVINLINQSQGQKNWTKIGKALNIGRRIVKRGYESWKKNQSKAELAAARINVVSESLKDHINNIVKLAICLSMKLDLPASPKVQMTNCTFINDLLAIDILGQTDLYQPLYIDKPRKIEFIRRGNKLLYDSLLKHAQESNISHCLGDWGEAWDNSLSIFQKFRHDIVEMISNFLNLQNISIEQVRDGTEKEDPIGSLVDAILEPLWNDLLHNDEDIKLPWAKLSLGLINETQSKSKVTFQTTIKVDDDIVVKLTDISAAKKLLKIIETTMGNMDKLCKDTVLQTAHDDMATMKKAIDCLNELLNPIRLRPMIIRSKCGMCPI